MSETEQAICKGCEKPFTRATVTPHLREYCSRACRQKAYREREKERQHNVTVDTEAQARIIELERQVEVQVHNIESSEQYAAKLETELARYRKVVDLSDRQGMIAQFMLVGEEIGYKPLSSVDVRLGPHAWYAFSQTADTEHLGAAIVAAKNVYKQLADLQTTKEVAVLNDLVTDLRQKLRECEKGKQA